MTSSLSLRALRLLACAAWLALPAPALAQDADSEAILRVERLENQLRQMTGAIEQLQFRNQQLEQQLKRLQEDIEFRLQQPGGVSAARPAAPQPAASQPAAPAAAPGPRASSEPLDLARLNPQGAPPPAAQMPPQGAPVLATAPPAGSPRDEFDLGYGYVLRRDYALAEQTLRDFLQKYPTDALAGDAHYWLGESLFQRQQYREAAESFLAVTTKFARTGKAPDSLLRLGQSLAALKEKEAACSTLAEVGRKYPRASAGVKQGVGREQKRLGC